VYAFNILRDYFGLPSNAVWYVGDDPLVDVVGALNAGMNAIWFNELNGKFPTNIPGPTAIVTDITGILDFLGSASSVDS
jgi:putative hydrolase of the HAD superfamily